VVELISKLLSTSDEELPDFLGRVDAWKWPRSDLNAWIKILNRFDAILEEAIREYEIDKLQTKDFDPTTKRTVSEILRFERLLLENSTNRKMFNSYDVRSIHLTLVLYTNALHLPAPQ
jgi:E3 ubiquitin-protein ligase HUWE1